MATDTPSLEGKILEPVEDLMDKFGLMQGEYAPVKRALVGAGLGAAVVFGLKPSLFWTKDGHLAPWRVTNPKDPDATPFPWYLAVALPAVVLGVLI